VRPRLPADAPVQCILKTEKEGPTFYEPQWMPDGLSVVFLYTIPPDAKRGGRAGVAQVNADGGDYRRLVAMRAREAGAVVAPEGLSLAPDGCRMVFLQDTRLPGRESLQELFVLETQTASLIPMDPYYILKMKGPLPVRFSRGSWNRKDGTICFGAVNPPSISVQDDRLCGLWTARANASYASAILKERRLDFSRSDPSWSPSSQYLAFWRPGADGYTLVYWKKGDESLRRAVTLRKPVPFWWKSDSSAVAWLDKGSLWVHSLAQRRSSALYRGVAEPCALYGDFSRIAYARGGSVYVQGAARTEKAVCSMRSDVSGLAWSPNGRRLAITARGSLWIVRERKLAPLTGAAR